MLRCLSRGLWGDSIYNQKVLGKCRDGAGSVLWQCKYFITTSVLLQEPASKHSHATPAALL